MNSMKRQKDMTPEDEVPGLVSVQYATGEEQRYSPICYWGRSEIASERMKRLGQVEMMLS